MPLKDNETFDVVVVGSGAAAFATALGAIDEGLSVVMVESTDKWGGNTAMSGGGLWMPNNPLMKREGAGDSREEAIQYMKETIGDPGPASSQERIEAYVDSIDDFVLTAEKYGMKFMRAADYPDYYPELPGGKIGRAIEGANFDLKKIGPWADSQRDPMPIPMRTDDVWLLGRAWSTPGGFVRGAQFVFRTIGGLATGKKMTGIGGALVAQFANSVLVNGRVPLYLETPAVGLEMDGKKVVGVRVQDKDGGERVIRANRGVMLAAGGFESNAQWRKKYQDVEDYTSGSPGNLGVPIEFAMEIGAAVDYMDDAWWGASLAPAGDGIGPSFLVGERSLPYMIIVDSKGKRFANEAESYVDLGHHMLQHDRNGDYWMITAGPYSLKYFRTFSIMPGVLKGLQETGAMYKTKTLAELATKIGVDPATLKDTVRRFNGFAKTGIDQDFHKGNSAYDRYYGDPTNRPNPCMAPLEKGPFTAYKIVTGDLGTKGGLVTDVDSRVLRENGSVIEGLYAAGNTTASVMGHTYPGPGSTIGPAAVFGLRAARHMARSDG